VILVSHGQILAVKAKYNWGDSTLAKFKSGQILIPKPKLLLVDHEDQPD
jgi:hypothetical protein